MKVSIIVPCYNEEGSIGEVLRRVEALDLPLEREVIVVDDGSTDTSAEIVRTFTPARLVSHPVNEGKGGAIKTGVENASGDLIVIQDADLEYDPSDIPSLVRPLLEGQADVVLGARFKGRARGMSLSHYLANKALSSVASLLVGTRITDLMTGYKAFTKEAWTGVTLASRGFEAEAELVTKFARVGLRIVEVPISYTRRPFGHAKITWKHGFTSLPTILRYG